MVLPHSYIYSDYGSKLKKARLVITVTLFTGQPDMDDTNLINVCGLVASVDNPFSCVQPNKSVCVGLFFFFLHMVSSAKPSTNI